MDCVFESVARESSASDIHGGNNKIFVAGQVMVPLKTPSLRNLLSSWTSIPEWDSKHMFTYWTQQNTNSKI